MKKGIITTYVLVFGAIFLIMLVGLLSFILMQLRIINQKVAWNQALGIAEAGMSYYRWCLNNEVAENCLLNREYQDLTGNSIGEFSLNSDITQNCGITGLVKIVSSGWTHKFPDLKRKISVFYGRESVAKYSYIINDNLWIGQDHEIRGHFHSNGGIRFDGENQSLVTSTKENWVCTESFGCSPCPTTYGCKVIGSNCLCPGVFTTTKNSNPNLFSFPVPPFDFTGITIDLAQLKTFAQNSGIYLQPSKNINPQGKGYRLRFFRDPTTGTGKVEVRIITNLSPTWAYSLQEGWHYNYFTITSEYTFNTYTIPTACPAIFVEDNLWPEGKIKGKIIVASANLIDPNLDTDVILQANIDYLVKDGSDGLTLIGERNILIGPDSPNKMELRGIFVAQKGRFGRNHYPQNFREKLEIYGSIVSNGRVGTQWTSGSQVVSGYLKRETYVDPYLLYDPPVFTPFIGSQYKIIRWEEL